MMPPIYTEPTWSHRIGKNPNSAGKVAKDSSIPPILAAMITHLPDDGSDYHRFRHEIVKYALRSMMQNTGVECHFLIWDNGSGWALRDRLQRIAAGGVPVFLSSNIGKRNAIRRIYTLYPDYLVNISDDDVLHYPGWLDEQINTLRAFDQEDGVGVVSGVTTSYQCQPESYPANMGQEHIIPPEWDYQHGASIGRAKEHIKKDLENYRPRVIRRANNWAVLGAGHSQFLGYSSRLARFFPETDRLMGDLRRFDLDVHNAGLLRLMTFERTCRHLGNRLSETDREECERVVGSVHA